jgi:hypothetical protein
MWGVRRKRLGLGILAAVSCAGLLAACAGEPPAPAPVLMGAATTGAEIGSPVLSTASVMPSTPSLQAPRPNRSTAARHPSRHRIASTNRHTPAVPRAAHRKTQNHVAHGVSKRRHAKVAANSISLDAPHSVASPSVGSPRKSAAAAERSASWVSPAPSAQSAHD